MKFTNKQALAQFVGMLDEFLKSWCETFPECVHSKQTQLMFTTMVKTGNEERKQALIGHWHSLGLVPLPEHVRYRQPLQRLLPDDEQACMYHAMEYCDMPTLLKACETAQMPEGFDILSSIDLEQHYNDTSFSSEHKKAFWAYIGELNRLSRAHHGLQPIRVPTREELRNDIQKHRSQAIVNRPPSPSSGGSNAEACMQKAFGMSLMELVDLCKSHCSGAEEQAGLQALRQTLEAGDTLSAVVQLWAQHHAVGSPLQTACASGDAESLGTMSWAGLPTGLHAPLRTLLKKGSGDEDVQRAMRCLQKMASFQKLENTIPPKMMNQIEQYAQRLAVDVGSGQVNMSDLDLAKIGQDVLSNCTAEDMSAMAERLGDILPTLQSLQPPGAPALNPAAMVAASRK